MASASAPRSSAVDTPRDRDVSINCTLRVRPNSKAVHGRIASAASTLNSENQNLIAEIRKATIMMRDVGVDLERGNESDMVKQLEDGVVKYVSGRRGPSPPPPIEEKSTLEKIKEWLSEHSPELKEVVPAVMFESANLEDSCKSNQAEVIVYSDEMKRAHSLTQRYKKDTPYVKVSARDMENRKYELLLSRNETGFVLTKEWRKLVDAIDVKKGYPALGYGYDKFKGEFRVLIARKKDLPTDNGLEIFMFEKTLNANDLDKPIIKCCSKKLDLAIRKAPWRSYVRAFATDPKGFQYEISFSHHDQGEGSFTLLDGWQDIVARNGFEEGDIVTAIGKICPLTFSLKLNLYVFKKENSDGLGKATILLFEKELEPVDTQGLLVRLDVLSCKDVVKAAVHEMLEAHAGYVRVSATDEEGRKYKLRLSRGEGAAVYVLGNGWRAVVANNGLKSGDKVWCWGSSAEDGSIKMRIDVDKALA